MRLLSIILIAVLAPVLSSCIMQVNHALPVAKSKEVNVYYENLNEGYHSVDKGWSKEKLQREITGKTFVRNYPNPKKANEILYFNSNNIVYQWSSANQSVYSATWILDYMSLHMGESAKLLVCFSLRNPSNEVVSRLRCIDPSLLYIPATEHVDGDVFAITGKNTSPGVLTDDRVTIDALKKQFPVKK